MTDAQFLELRDISVSDLEAAGWRSTARGEWTHDYFGPKGGSGLAFSFGQAQMWEGFARARYAEINARVNRK
jgi:hypothetical protein